MDMMSMDMDIEKGKKKKKKKVVEPDYSQFDDTYHWSRVKRDKNFFGHTKCQTLF